MKILDTNLPEVKLIEPKVFGDQRGFFLETWNARTFAEHGIDTAFVQDNHSRSSRGVLRGLHYQLVEPQGKLVRVGRGRIFDVAIDIRKSSPRFGEWAGAELSGENHRLLWIPPGFAHGFLALEDDTDVLYKCTALYSPAHDRGIAWNDSDIDIAWPLEGIASPALSDKDAAAPRLCDAEVFA